MTKLLITAAIISLTLAVAAHADPKTTYVGGGRYTCKGDSAACAQIDANNRVQSERSSRQYQRDQDRAQDYVDRDRRREEERRNERQRY